MNLISKDDKFFNHLFKDKFCNVQTRDKTFAVVYDERTGMCLDRTYLIDSEKKDIIKMSEKDVNFDLVEVFLNPIKISEAEEEYFKDADNSSYCYFKSYNEWKEYQQRYSKYLEIEAYKDFYKKNIKQ